MSCLHFFQIPEPQEVMYWRMLLPIPVVTCIISILFRAEEYIPRPLMISPSYYRFETNVNEPAPSIWNSTRNISVEGKGRNKNGRGIIYMAYRGRLGNNLFQYAMLLAVRNLTGRPVYFVTAINLSTIFQRISIPILYPSHGITEKLNRLTRKKEDAAGVFMPNFIADIPSSDVVICCYFQAFKYFYFMRDTVKQEFTFRKEIRNRVDAILHRARRECMGPSTANNIRYIGIHVRRGDLASPALYAEGYRVPEVSYFKKAKAYFRKLYSETLQFVVTSDIKPWALRYLRGPDTYISPSMYDYIDLALLAACNDTIMSLSTFSWWAGFLAGGKTVYFKDFTANGTKADRLYSVEDRFFTSDWIPMGNWLIGANRVSPRAQCSAPRYLAVSFLQI